MPPKVPAAAPGRGGAPKSSRRRTRAGWCPQNSTQPHQGGLVPPEFHAAAPGRAGAPRIPRRRTRAGWSPLSSRRRTRAAWSPLSSRCRTRAGRCPLSAHSRARASWCPQKFPPPAARVNVGSTSFSQVAGGSALLALADYTLSAWHVSLTQPIPCRLGTFLTRSRYLVGSARFSHVADTLSAWHVYHS